MKRYLRAILAVQFVALVGPVLLIPIQGMAGYAWPTEGGGVRYIRGRLDELRSSNVSGVWIADRFHRGVDIKAPLVPQAHENIYCRWENAQVIHTGSTSMLVYVEETGDTYGFEPTEPSVAKGTFVDPGDTIGKVQLKAKLGVWLGNPHCHFEHGPYNDAYWGGGDPDDTPANFPPPPYFNVKHANFPEYNPLDPDKLTPSYVPTWKPHVHWVRTFKETTEFLPDLGNVRFSNQEIPASVPVDFVIKVCTAWDDRGEYENCGNTGVNAAYRIGWKLVQSDGTVVIPQQYPLEFQRGMRDGNQWEGGRVPIPSGFMYMDVGTHSMSAAV